jgi:hypothetical protein
MIKRAATIACVVLIGLAAAGCTKCGWIWDSARSCQSETLPK